MQGFEIEFRKLSELEAAGGAADQNLLKVMRENPFRRGEDVFSRKVAFVGGKYAGGENVFPVEVKVKGATLRALTGNCTQIEEWARKSGVGLAISDFDGRGRDERTLFIGGALSQVAAKVHVFTGYRFFEFPRYVFPLHSRPVLGVKLNGAALAAGSFICDLLLGAWLTAVRMCAAVKTKGATVREVPPEDESLIGEIAKMTAEDDHPCAEVHDARWIKWVLTTSFSECGPCKAFIVEKGGVAVGFFIVKRRFHAQASHRGFRNVWLSSLVEWGCRPGFGRIVDWAVVKHLLRTGSGDDAVEFATADESQRKLLRRIGWRQVGCANFTYKFKEGSAPAGVDELMSSIESWRVRPAFGDYALS